MNKAFLQYINNNKLFLKNSKIILAVSGGVDSVVMANLFFNSGYKCIIAHCNFELRGEESNNDEKFVKEIALKYKFPFHNKGFKTEKYAKQKGISIQMAARELRYYWFNELIYDTESDCIAIAHNRNDVVETFFLNLTRGTGLKGLTGIKNKLDKIVRPLLFANRSDIEEYAKEKKISYREDSSNNSLKYSRNRLRNRVLPELKKINPSIETTICETIHRFEEYQQIIENEIEDKKKLVFSYRNELILINIKKLIKLNSVSFYLFGFISPFGFNFSDVVDIVSTLNSQSGKMFYSSSYLLVKDREYLIIKKTGNKNEEFFIEKNMPIIDTDIRLEFKHIKIDNSFKIDKSNNIALIDADKIAYPLKLRKWNDGDKFMPLGMRNLKKLSDFFSDNKLSVIDKQDTWIIENNNEIIWIVGLRIDNRYKITDKTKNALIISKI